MNDKRFYKLIDEYTIAEAGISERVMTIRKELGLSQKQLGELAGSNKAAIQKIEIGKSVRPRCLGALAIVLGVNPAWLAWGDYASRDLK